jgi:hypothetical protein
MRWLLYFVALILFLPGLMFFLQGVNVLPGSYMTGNPQWAINGGIMMVIALGLAAFAGRRK